MTTDNERAAWGAHVLRSAGDEMIEDAWRAWCTQRLLMARLDFTEDVKPQACTICTRRVLDPDDGFGAYRWLGREEGTPHLIVCATPYRGCVKAVLRDRRFKDTVKKIAEHEMMVDVQTLHRQLGTANVWQTTKDKINGWTARGGRPA